MDHDATSCKKVDPPVSKESGHVLWRPVDRQQEPDPPGLQPVAQSLATPTAQPVNQCDYIGFIKVILSG